MHANIGVSYVHSCIIALHVLTVLPCMYILEYTCMVLDLGHWKFVVDKVINNKLPLTKVSEIIISITDAKCYIKFLGL